MTKQEIVELFVVTTFTREHERMRMVFDRYSSFKATKYMKGTEVFTDADYKEFAAQYSDKMFILSAIRQFEHYTAQQKLAA